MKAYLQIALFVLISFAVKAQQNYFVYLQTDNKQPFYVKMKDKVLSSSSSGYVVIPKLSTGDYALTVGFPKDEWPQQSLALKVGNNDAGYLLKNFGEKGWGLYNIQTMEITMNGGTAPQKTADNDDMFANALAGAANTSLNTPKDPKTVPLVDNAEPQVPVIKQISNAIEKVNSTNDTDGRYLVYIDHTGAKNDTVPVFIPAEAVSGNKQTPTKTTTEPVTDKKFLDIDLQNPNTKAADQPVTQPPSNNKPVVAFNSDCRTFALDDDFLKIRKKMAAETNDDAMVNAARRFLKAKCYSVEQIKNLSLLFLTDAGKYKFFDAAYPRTHDTQNFASLQSQLSDDYYITRFKAMIRN